MKIADQTGGRTPVSVFCVLLLFICSAAAQIVPGSMNVHWDAGAADCSKVSPSPLQVHAYNRQTFLLRQNLCSTFEAPFLYLLIGSSKALLIDTGDVADPQKMPLAKTVLDLLPSAGSDKFPLLVVHTHRHLDHRAGDGQFKNLPNVQVVGYELEKVKEFYHFSQWPNGTAQIDLGDRIFDVIPSPGHNETEVSFYDRNTGLFFSGDFLIPGRLLIDDTPAELATAQRVADFVRNRPVSFVLGGHIEKNAAGELLPWESQSHPNEHVLQLTKEDILALPAAVQSFNGFYTTGGQFVMMNSMRMLYLYAGFVVILLAVFVWLVIRFLRRRRARRLQQGLSANLRG